MKCIYAILIVALVVGCVSPSATVNNTDEQANITSQITPLTIIFSSTTTTITLPPLPHFNSTPPETDASIFITGKTRSMGNVIEPNDRIYIKYAMFLNESEISVGDIVAYKRYRYDRIDGWIIHRIIMQGNDENGIFWIPQGDNNTLDDYAYWGVKLRQEGIYGKVIGVKKRLRK